jgi:3,4-dihydroxy-9,10-secoandrosta-1,3,5(10)-triene-9,17-dione 4,5-dioxygenase
MDIRALGYIGLGVTEPLNWHGYAALLGTMPSEVDSDGGFDIRIDERPFRIVVQPADGADHLIFVGWELPDAAALTDACAELEHSGYHVSESTPAEAASRRVRGLVRTTDPGGFTVELFWGPILDHELFVSPTGLTGFVTGDMGLGHMVLGTTNFAESVAFYTHLLGFRVTDYMGTGTDEVVFTHCNPRHHSLALIAAPESTLYHFMLEVATLDDVGYTLDRLETAQRPISMGLGKHTNDQMVSFYSRSPSGFDVEFGTGGLRVDDATWTIAQITKASLWGHRRGLETSSGGRNEIT